MKVAYFDCIAGASGDMILGALLDAGLTEEKLRADLELLHLHDFTLRCRPVSKQGFRAIKVDILVQDDVPVRHLPEIEAIVLRSDLPTAIKDQAVAIFRRLGEVEAEIHGTSLDQVHLHELGGVDTIVDIVGVLCGLAALKIDQIITSPLPMGRGFVTGAHGQIPLPAPATVGLLKGVPLVGSDINMELVTPTGAALLTTLTTSYGAIPTMTLTDVGYGAGGRDLKIPNVLRLLIGEQLSDPTIITETLTVLETNIDDLNPEFYDFVMQRLFQAGALDVFLSPLQMKKNRPATLLQVLCRPDLVEALRYIIFSETSTLGIRQQMVTRHSLPRSIERVETIYGDVRVKLATLDNLSAGYSHDPASRTIKFAPEYDDCCRLANEHGVAIQTVYRLAQEAAHRAFVLES